MNDETEEWIEVVSFFTETEMREWLGRMEAAGIYALPGAGRKMTEAAPDFAQLVGYGGDGTDERREVLATGLNYPLMVPADQADAARAILQPSPEDFDTPEEPLFPPCPVCHSGEIEFVKGANPDNNTMAFLVIFAGVMTLGLFALYHILTRPAPYRCMDCGESFRR